jgi:hypothetical protein
MADKYTTARSNDPRALGSDAVPHTPADTDLALNTKAVVFDADGTITFKNAAGTSRAGYPVVKGIPLLFVPTRITAMSGPTTCYLIQ